ALKSSAPTATIQDTAGNAMTSFAATGTTQSYVEDNTAPTLTTVFRQTPSSSPTNADSLVFRVTFSEDVTGLDAADFVVGGTTGTVTSISAVGGSANVYDVTVSGGDL